MDIEAFERDFRADLLRQYAELTGAALWWIEKQTAEQTISEIQEQVYTIRLDNGETL